jgi:hypothetical protein
MTSPSNNLRAFAPGFVLASPGAGASNFDSAATERTEVDLNFDTGLPRRFEWLNLIRSANQKPFSSADEHDAEPLFLSAREEFPSRVFKIHKRCALAMEFTYGGKRRHNSRRCGGSATPCNTQRVGVARISTLKFSDSATQTTEYFKIYLS